MKRILIKILLRTPMKHRQRITKRILLLISLLGERETPQV
jgi:hypothetical protein